MAENDLDNQGVVNDTIGNEVEDPEVAAQRQASEGKRQILRNAGKLAWEGTKKVAQKFTEPIVNFFKKVLAKIAEFLAPALSVIITILIILFVAIGLIGFILNVPGFMKAKLNDIIAGVVDSISDWWYGNNRQLSPELLDVEKRKELLNYISSDLGFDVVGFGFVPTVTYAETNPETGEDLRGKQVIVDYSTQIGNINKAKNGKVSDPNNPDADLMYYYLVANERAYIQRDNGIAGWLFGTKQDWNGMLYIDDETFSDSKVEVDRKNKRLKISNPNRSWSDWFNRDNFSYSLEGWTGRYGMPVEFSLALHIASMSSGLVKEMITNENLQTNVKIKLEKFNCDLNFEITLKNGETLKIPFKAKDDRSDLRIKMNEYIELKNNTRYTSVADYVALAKKRAEISQNLSIQGLSDAASYMYKKHIINESMYGSGGVGYKGVSRVIDAMSSILGNEGLAVRLSYSDPETLGNGKEYYYDSDALDQVILYQPGRALRYSVNSSVNDDFVVDGFNGYNLDSGAYVCAVNEIDQSGEIDYNTGKLGSRITGGETMVNNDGEYTSEYRSIRTSQINGFSCNQQDNNYELFEQFFTSKGYNNEEDIPCSTIQLVPKALNKKYTIQYNTGSGQTLTRSFITVRGLGSYYNSEAQISIFLSRIVSDNDMQEGYRVTLKEIDWFLALLTVSGQYDGYSWHFPKMQGNWRQESSQYKYYSNMYDEMINYWKSGNTDAAIAKYYELFNQLNEDYQNVSNISESYEVPFIETMNQILKEIGDGITWETIQYIVFTLAGGVDMNNPDVEYSSPYIDTVTKHWFKDILFEYEKTSEPIKMSYTGEEFDGLQVDAILYPQKNYEYNTQSGSPYIVKGDIITKDGVLVEDENEKETVLNKFNESINGKILANAGVKASYTAGDGYRTTKKIFTQGYYYKFDGSAETARSVFWQQQLENAEPGTAILVTVSEGKIINATTQLLDNNTQQINYNKNPETPAQLIWESGGNTNEKGEYVPKKSHYVFIASDDYKYVSPTEKGKTYTDVQDSVERINGLWEYMKVASRREQLSFDNVTSSGEIIAATGLSILKNCNTIDADYIYRDLKEMLIDLGYYTEAEFDQLDVQLKWFIPRYNPSVWPQNSVNDLTFASVLYPLDEEAEEEEEIDESQLTDEEKEELAKKRASEQLNTLSENVKGFKPHLKVIAPAACEVLEVHEDSIEIKFDGVEQPDIGIMNGYVMTIRGIIPASDAVEGKKYKAEDEIGRTGTDKIEVFLKNDIGRVLSNVSDYMAPRKASSQPYEFTDDEIVLLAYVINHEANPSGMVNQMQYDIDRGYCISYTDAYEAAMAYGEAVGYVLINRALQNYGNHGTTIEEQTTAPGQYDGSFTIEYALAHESDISPSAMEAALVCATYDCDIILKPDDPLVKMTRDVTGESAWTFGHQVFWWLDMDRTEGIANRGKDVMDEYAHKRGTGTAEHPYPVEVGMGSDDGSTGNKSWPWDGYLTYSN